MFSDEYFFWEDMREPYNREKKARKITEGLIHRQVSVILFTLSYVSSLLKVIQVVAYKFGIPLEMVDVKSSYNFVAPNNYGTVNSTTSELVVFVSI